MPTNLPEEPNFLSRLSIRSIMSRLTKNIIYNLLGQASLLLLGFVSVKYIFGRLGEDALGIIYFTLLLNSISTKMLQLGICSVAVREISANYKDNPKYCHDLIRTGSFFFWTSFVVLGIAIYFLAPIIVDKWITLKTLDSGTATYVLRILLIGSLVALPQSLYTSLFNGLQRMGLANIIEVGISVLRQFGTIIILTLGGNLFSVVYFYVLCYGISIIISLIYLARFFPLRSFIPRYYSKVVKKNKGFASMMSIITGIGIIYRQVDKLIISTLMSVGVLGYYTFASATVSKGSRVAGAISRAAYPSFSSLLANGKRKALMVQYKNMQDIICFVTVPVFAAIPYACLPVISYIFNEEIAGLLLWPISLLSFAFYIAGTMHVPYYVSLAMGKPSLSAKALLYQTSFSVPTTTILIYYYGLFGAGLSVMFAELFGFAYFVPRVCSECLKISAREWYWHVLKILILASLTYGLGWFFLGMIGNYSILSLAMSYIGATIGYLVCSYFMINEKLREIFSGYIRLFRKRLVRNGRIGN